MNYFPRFIRFAYSPNNTFEGIVEGVGVAGLYLCALGTWLSTAVQNIGLALVILTFIVDRRAWRWVLSIPVFWLCGIIAAYALTRGHFAAAEFPTTAELQLKFTERWFKLTLFVPIAWYLWCDPKRIPRTLILCGLGLLIGTLASLNPETLKAIFNGVRYGGHLKKPIAYAFYISVCLLGVTVLAPRWLSRPNDSRAAYWAKNTGTGILIAALTWLFLTTQSRGPLFALTCVLPIAIAIRYWPQRRKTPEADHHVWHIVIGIGLAVALLGASSANMLVKRISAELPGAELVLSENLSQLPRNNTTLRLQMWKFGLEKWSERPWFGWGPGSTQYILSTGNDPALRNDVGEYWDHLHNAYIQTLFSFGIVGFGLAGSLIALLCLGVIQRYREGELHRDYAIFLLGNFSLIALYSLTDFRHLNHDWSSYWLILAAITLASGTTGNRNRLSAKSHVDGALS